MTDYSKRIPTAIADGERHLQEHQANPDKFGSKSCIYLTAGEVALADGLRQAAENLNAEFGGERWPPELIAFCEKIERLSHD